MQRIDDQLDGAGLVQPHAEGEHGEDQHQRAAVDRAPRLFGLDAAGQQDHRDPGDGQRHDGQVENRRAQHHGGQRGDGDGRAGAAEALHGGIADFGQVDVALQGHDRIIAGGDQQAVAGAHAGVGKVRPGKVARTGEAEHADLQARQHRDLGQPAADHRVGRGDDCRDEPRVGRSFFLGRRDPAADAGQADAEIAPFGEGGDFGGTGGDDQLVARGKDDIGHVPALQFAALPHGQDAYARAARHARIAQLLADQRAVLRHHQVTEVTFVLRHRFVLPAGAVGKQKRAEHDQRRDTGRSGDEADQRNLENAEGGKASLGRDTVHQQVGGGADQRDRAAKDRKIGQRNQQAGGCRAQHARQPFQDGDHHDHHRRVVHEGRGRERAGTDFRHRQPRLAQGAADDPARDFLQRAGAQQGAAQHEHRPDGNRRVVAEHAQDRVGIDEAQRQHDDRPCHGDGHRRAAFEEERDEYPDEEGEADNRRMRIDEGHHGGHVGW